MLFCSWLFQIPHSAIRCLFLRHSDFVLELWACPRLHSWTWHFNVHAHTPPPPKKKERRRRGQHAHTNTLTHFTKAVGEPECRAWGLLCLWCLYCLLCCPSACRRLLHIFASVRPCIINSDCCGQQATVQESCKAVQREEKVVVGEGKDRRRPKDHWVYLFPLYLFTYYFLLFLGSALILYPQTSGPMGHQLSDSQRRVPPLFLSSLLSLFGIWDTHRFAPRESFGNPR